VDTAALALVKEAYGFYITLCAVRKEAPRTNEGKKLERRYLDCAVFETLHYMRDPKTQKEFDTVRAFFVEGGPLYPDAGLHAQDHVQICVRKTKNIIGCFLVD
jgi:hypothetical protein